MRIRLGHPIDTVLLKATYPDAVQLFQRKEAFYLTTDSRKVECGDIFVALEGQRTSGDAYLLAARASGAAAAIRRDGLRILYALAHEHRKRLSLHSIAITGSVGKTSTKELLRSLLSVRYRVHANEGNFNNELGVPLTLLSTPSDTDILITELGMRRRGEIGSLSRLTCPECAVITAIGQSHLESMGSLSAVREAKLEITEGLSTNGDLYLGVGIMPPPSPHSYTCHTLSQAEGETPSVTDIAVTKNGSEFTLTVKDKSLRSLFIPVQGAHLARNAALAVMVALQYGLREEEIRQGLSRFRNAKSRTDIRRIKGITLIEDCYNASPESMLAAAELLKSMRLLYPESRIFALLGDMLELGEDSTALHIAVGQIFGRLPLSGLYSFGEHAGDILSGAAMTGFSGILSPQPMRLTDILVPGDILLVKASRGMKAEGLTAAILEGGAR